MKLTLKRNPTDSAMIEFYYTWNRSTLLACVMHEDCLEEYELLEIIDKMGEATVRMVAEEVTA